MTIISTPRRAGDICILRKGEDNKIIEASAHTKYGEKILKKIIEDEIKEYRTDEK